MFRIVDKHVFPFLQSLDEEGSSYGTHMKDARLGFSNPALLAKVVQMIDEIPMDDRDTKGDVYEYMLGKIASACQNGQFRTPRHIIKLMVHLMAPTPQDVICDPAAGTCGFLVAAGEYLRDTHPQILRNDAQRKHFHSDMFHGFDFDATMLRIGAMNMTLHGVENPDISYRDSLAEEHGEDAGRYSLILANPPFAGSLDYDTTAKDLLKIVKTKKTEQLFVALFLRLLRTGGRAAVVVPDGVLFGSSTAHKAIRKMLVEDHKLDAIIKLPSGVFRPYAGVSCAILEFTKTGVGGTENVWFYDTRADGYSLDDKRTPLLDDAKLGPVPSEPLTEGEHAKNNLPDILTRWQDLGAEADRPRTAQSFMVPLADIQATGSWDLSLNRYKEIEHEEVHHDAPADIIAAHAIAIRATGLAYALPAGLLQASVVRASCAEGLASVHAQRDIIASGLAVGCTAGAILFMLIATVAVFLQDLFNASTMGHSAATTAVALLFLVAIFQLDDAPGSVAAGILLGRLDTRAPMVMTLAGYWGISAPLGIWLANTKDMGAVSIWDRPRRQDRGIVCSLDGAIKEPLGICRSALRVTLQRFHQADDFGFSEIPARMGRRIGGWRVSENGCCSTIESARIPPFVASPRFAPPEKK